MGRSVHDIRQGTMVRVHVSLVKIKGSLAFRTHLHRVVISDMAKYKNTKPLRLILNKCTKVTRTPVATTCRT